MTEVKEGYIIDYISGQQLKATPEEVEAVQVFARVLVEDYGYPKAYIQTRPQFHVKVRPSDLIKEYPVDIAVFSDTDKTDNSIFIIVECKKKNRRDGRTQLENYMTLSKAQLGVWFNGEERFYIQKFNTADGRVEFKEIPNIPKFGEGLDSIGAKKRRDLAPTHNLKSVFKSIRGFLVGNATGTNRDEIIAQQLINLIFCKIYDEKFSRADDVVKFRVGIDESDEVVIDRIHRLFDSVKTKYSEVIEISDKITLDAKGLRYVIGELQNFCLIESQRDVIADAFETFIDGALKGGEGQFFTPRNVVKLLVDLIDPKPNELIIDPACGTGGFLVESLRHIWDHLEKDAVSFGWNELALAEEKNSSAIKCIRGVEKDEFLCKVTKAYMAILGDGKGGICCENSLDLPSRWKEMTQQYVRLGTFDVLLANPPFGKDIKVTGEEILKQFDLAHVWENKQGEYNKTTKIKKEELIQILFIERCLKLLKSGGRMGIILPETFFHAPSLRYILRYMLQDNNVMWVIDLPHNTFRPHNNAKCLAIIVQKNRPQQEFINMAVAEQIGHDHQGKEMYRWNYQTNKVDKTALWDDIPNILQEASSSFNKYCFSVNAHDVRDKDILVPRYYWENKIVEIEQIAESKGLHLLPLQRLIDEKIVDFFDGHGSPPAEFKGKGDVPYIRVKDIVNWEIYKDPTSKITKKIYTKIKGNKKDLHVNDIAYVRRGSYRIGSVAMISPFDIDALYTREILILRVINEKNEYGINPYYLLYLLSHQLTQLQATNKIFIDTTLPNIADRWKELLLPIDNNKEAIKDISEKIKRVMESKWRAVEQIQQICEELGTITT